MTQPSRFRIRPGALLSQTRAFLPALILASFVLLATQKPLRGNDVFQPGGDETAALFDKAKSSVVQVRSGDKGFILSGSGFFVDDQGTVLTSSSILGDNTRARVVINGVEIDAKIIGNDPRSGLAMLRVAYDQSPFLPLGRSTVLKTGDSVTLVGFPMNLALAPSQGVVSGFDASYLSRVDPRETVAKVERFATTHIHANVAISPGQVGGPLLDSQGEVVGLVATSPDQGKSIYALPVEAIDKIISDFNLYGRARFGWVGVNVMEAPDTGHDGRTVRVVQVVPNTPASQSGILPGDIVMRIDAREIYRPADVLDASFFSHVGGNMTVVVRRADKLSTYTFAVIEHPLTPAAAPTHPVTIATQPAAIGFAANLP